MGRVLLKDLDFLLHMLRDLKSFFFALKKNVMQVNYNNLFIRLAFDTRKKHNTHAKASKNKLLGCCFFSSKKRRIEELTVERRKERKKNNYNELKT